MTTYCIDYRNGAMGNTLLAHILYSCCKIDIDFNNFFSTEGNSHHINYLSNNLELVANHLLEFPDPGVTCLIELTTSGWTTVLRHKMSYAKWHKKYPSEYNYSEFFKIIIDHSTCRDKLWQEFYQLYKDPQWPECSTYAEITNLTPDIQNEILQVYLHPDKNYSVLNLLTISYYDILKKNHVLNFPKATEYKLEDYLDSKFDSVKTAIHDKLNWSWDDRLSRNFHRHVLRANSVYLKWLENIVEVFTQCVNFTPIDVELEFWERAILIARICQHFSIHPNSLDWNGNHCFLKKNNVSLILHLKEINNGKTI